MSFPIADYISHQFTGLTGSKATEVINILPAQYQSNFKADYCLISVVDCIVDKGALSHPLFIELVSPRPQNNTSSRAIIASLTMGNAVVTPGDTATHFQFIPKDIKYLIPARPSQLGFKFIADLSDTEEHLFICAITLKMEYISKKHLREMDEETNYETF